LFKTSSSIVNLQEHVREVIFSRRAYDAMLNIVKNRYPLEACGVMFGNVSGYTATVVEVEEIKNVLESKYRFWFDVGEWMNSILKAKKRGLEYIGLFHSHVRGSPIPSLADRHRMLECPEEIWIIVSYTPEEEVDVTAWRIDDWGSSIMKLALSII